MEQQSLRELQNNKALKRRCGKIKRQNSLRELQNNKALKLSRRYTSTVQCLRELQNNKALKPSYGFNRLPDKFKRITKQQGSQTARTG